MECMSRLCTNAISSSCVFRFEGGGFLRFAIIVLRSCRILVWKLSRPDPSPRQARRSRLTALGSKVDFTYPRVQSIGQSSPMRLLVAMLIDLSILDGSSCALVASFSWRQEAIPAG